MKIELPDWITDLRNCEVSSRLSGDPRSTGKTLLGVDSDTAFHDVLKGGQADFDAPHGIFTSEDRVLLYAHLLQKGHLEELLAVFQKMRLSDNIPDQPVVIDLGCGPFTGGLALAGAIGRDARFDYVGMDRSSTMQELGERLAVAASLDGVHRIWSSDLTSVQWTSAPGWRPVLVIVSYLLKSPTLKVLDLVTKLTALLNKIGRGRVTVLYTNAIGTEANRNFPQFQDALFAAGFKLRANDQGEILVRRGADVSERRLRYALFHRPKQTELQIGGRN